MTKLITGTFQFHVSAYQVQITEGILQLQRKHVLLQRHKVQGEFGDIHISDDARLFENCVAYEGPSRYPENGEFMFNIAIPLQALDLIYGMSAHSDGIHSDW